MILRTRQMVEPETVPQYDIGVLHLAIVRRPCWQPVVAGRLVNEFASREALFRVKRRHPDLMLDETAAPARRAVRVRERLHRRTGLQLVAGRRADPVPRRGIDDL